LSENSEQKRHAVPDSFFNKFRASLSGRKEWNLARSSLLRCMSQLLARLRLYAAAVGIPLTAAKRTCGDRVPRAGFDPLRTSSLGHPG